MTSNPTPTRYFGVTKHSAQQFVCDVAGTVELGSFVLAPDADGELKRRKVLRLGEPFERRGELFVYGYLADGFQSGRNLKEAGWTLKQIGLLGPAEVQRTNPIKASGPPTKLWSDATVDKVQRTQEFQELIRTPEQRAVARESAAKANATKQVRISQILSGLSATITRIDPGQLLTLAIADANRVAERDGAELVTTETDPALLGQIQIGFVCKYLTRSDDHRGKFGRLVSRDRVSELMDEKILASISDAYPHLAVEAARHRRNQRI